LFSVIEKLPRKRSTQIMLAVGSLGVIGVITSFVLILFPSQGSQNGELVLSVTPIPDVDTKTGNTELPLEGSLVVENLSIDTKVSVNTATLKELEELPHIGEKKASNIHAARPYKSLNEFFTKNPFSEEQTTKLMELIKL